MRTALAILVFVFSALAPAAAMKAVSDGGDAPAVSESNCDCCDEMRIDAALGCAAFCHAALPSEIGAAPTVALSRTAMVVWKSGGEGLTLEPPAPPPRA